MTLGATFSTSHSIVNPWASSQKFGADPFVNPGQKGHDESSSANLPQNIEKIHKLACALASQGTSERRVFRIFLSKLLKRVLLSTIPKVRHYVNGERGTVSRTPAGFQARYHILLKLNLSKSALVVRIVGTQQTCICSHSRVRRGSLSLLEGVSSLG